MDGEAFALDQVNVLADGDDRDQAHVVFAEDGDAVEVEVHPSDGADLAAAQAGAEGEADQVGQVGADGGFVGVDERQEAAALLGGEAARGSGAVAFRGLDAFQLADRVGGDGLVQDGLLEDAADDRADLAARVCRVGRLLGGRAVRVLARPPGAFQAREEGVELGDVALVEA